MGGVSSASKRARTPFGCPAICVTAKHPHPRTSDVVQYCDQLKIVSTCRPDVFDKPTHMQLAFSHPLILEQKNKATRCWQICYPLSVCSRAPETKTRTEKCSKDGL